ncbi:hypothetical protein [Agrobacterium sp. MA01]|uniref:hypothetical protein n=1 Tax=Agrobacterium sp. MA01 TaxID=2664893 RepID=UPI00352A49FA
MTSINWTQGLASHVRMSNRAELAQIIAPSALFWLIVCEIRGEMDDVQRNERRLLPNSWGYVVAVLGTVAIVGVPLFVMGAAASQALSLLVPIPVIATAMIGARVRLCSRLSSASPFGFSMCIHQARKSSLPKQSRSPSWRR